MFLNKRSDFSNWNNNNSTAFPFSPQIQYRDKNTFKADNIKTHSQTIRSTWNFKRCLKVKKQQV